MKVVVFHLHWRLISAFVLFFITFHILWILLYELLCLLSIFKILLYWVFPLCIYLSISLKTFDSVTLLNSPYIGIFFNDFRLKYFSKKSMFTASIFSTFSLVNCNLTFMPSSLLKKIISHRALKTPNSQNSDFNCFESLFFLNSQNTTFFFSPLVSGFTQQGLTLDLHIFQFIHSLGDLISGLTNHC